MMEKEDMRDYFPFEKEVAGLVAVKVDTPRSTLATRV